MSDDISGSDRFVQTGELETTEVPDRAMIYQKDRERMHYLNPTAVIVFERCGMGKSGDEMVAFVADSSAAHAAGGEVKACLASLLQEGLLRRA